MRKEPLFFEGRSPERDALCEKLGIMQVEPKSGEEFIANIVVWAQIGAKLASETEEFAGKKGRGRPKLDGKDNDYWRAMYIRRTQGDGTQAEAVRRAMSEKAALFLGDDFATLKVSVARGNATIRKALSESQMLHAQWFRADCERLRQKKAHIEEMTKHVEATGYGLLGYLLHTGDR